MTSIGTLSEASAIGLFGITHTAGLAVSSSDHSSA
jgi:hypothetical protein